MDNISSILFKAIQSEFEAIQIYKETANIATTLNQPELSSALEEISRDEMVHVGNLLTLLKKFDNKQYEEFYNKYQEGISEVEKESVETTSKKVTDVSQFIPYTNLLVQKDSNAKYNTFTNEKGIKVVIEKSSLSNAYDTFRELKRFNISNSDDMNVIYDKEHITLCNYN